VSFHGLLKTASQPRTAHAVKAKVLTITGAKDPYAPAEDVARPRPPRLDPTGVPGQTGELLTVAEVAEMTRLSASSLRYWRYAGAGGPVSFKLGRTVMYRRADVEKWLEEA
jgi:predicted DNA-binding transcriptional regulator AlpA